MPGKTGAGRNSGREAGSAERGRMKSRRRDEPSLRDLRRRLVGSRRELAKKFVLSVCVISVSWLVASHVNLRQLARDYPAATDNSRAAISALVANTREAAGNLYAHAGSMLSEVHVPAAKSVAPAALRDAHGARMASAAHARRMALAAVARRHAALHEHMHHTREQAAAAATASASVMGDDLSGGTFDDFTTRLGNELGKAESMLLKFGYNAIDLNWAPGLRDWLSGEIQSATSSFYGDGTFRVNGLSSLLQSLTSRRGLLAAGAGLLVFMLMVTLSGWLRRLRRDVNGGKFVEY